MPAFCRRLPSPRYIWTFPLCTPFPILYQSQASLLKIERVKIFVYAITGFFCALAGAVLTSRLNSAQPTAGTGYELDAIAAVVLGGTSLSGGKGYITGTLVGVLIIGTLNNGLNILDVSSFYQQVVKGIVILLAVLMDRQKA